jgi:hypothetical protein
MTIFDEVSGSNGTNNTYPYHSFIKAPDKLGSSSKAKALPANIKALTAYVDTLVTGQSKAQTVSPLGNSYFMNTGGTCNDVNGVSQPRYVYINNIPDGDIPFISSAMGENLTEFEGLVPGVLGSLSYINPFKIFSAFDPATPCQEIKMPIRDITNATSEDSKYVCESDIKDYNPCWFSDERNPVTNEECPSNKKKKNKKKKNGMTTQFPKDPVLQVYAIGVYCLGAYILYRLVSKN